MTSDVRTPVVVDLIGDLDSTLIASFSETLSHLTHAGPTDVLLSTRHLAVASNDALVALDVAMSGARERGASIEIDPGSRKMRLAFTSARIDYHTGNLPRPAGARHFMIARHARTESLRRSA